MCKVYTRYHGCAPVRRDNPRAKARGLSLRTGAQTYSIFHLSRRCLQICRTFTRPEINVDVVVALLFYVHGKHLRSCRDGQLT